MNSHKKGPSTSAQARKELEPPKTVEENPILDEEINVIQLNMGKRQSCGDALALMMSEEAIDFCLVQEPPAGLNIPDVETVKAKGPTRAQILIRKSVAINMSYIGLSQFTDRDHAVALVKANLDGQIRSIVMVSMYCENKGPKSNPISTTMREIMSYATDNNCILLVNTDANAHNVAFGSSKTDARGRLFVDWIESNDQCLLNHGDTPTYNSTNSSSVIDITFCSNSFVKFIQGWQVLNRDSQSDHSIIFYQITLKSPRKILKRNVRETKWVGYEKSYKKKARNFNPTINCPADIDDAVALLICYILSAFEENCCLKENKYKRSSHFDEELRLKRSEMNKKKKKALRLDKNTTSKKDKKRVWNEAREAARAYNKENRRKKLLNKRRRISEINDIPKTARMMRILEGKKLVVSRTTVKVGELFTNNISETAKAFLKRHFVDAEPCGDPQKLPEVNPIPDYDEETLRKIEGIFTDASVSDSIFSLNPYKAPGLDGVFPVMLQKIGKLITPILRKIFIASMKFNYMPRFWRTQNVIFIPKQGKPSYDDPKAYRPICLASFIFKVMEKIIDRHIRDSILGTNVFDHRQHAYRKNRSTETCLLEFTKVVGKSYRGDKRALVVPVDFTQAFDSAFRQALLDAAKAKGIDTHLINFIESIMSSRAVKADFDVSDSTLR